MQTVGPYYVQLVLLIRRQVPQGQSRLTLDLGGRRIHEVDQRLDKLRFRRGQLPSVVRIDSNVAEGGRTVVLDIDVGGGEELHKYRDRAGINELLSVLICKTTSAFRAMTQTGAGDSEQPTRMGHVE